MNDNSPVSYFGCLDVFLVGTGDFLILERLEVVLPFFSLVLGMEQLEVVLSFFSLVLEVWVSLLLGVCESPRLSARDSLRDAKGLESDDSSIIVGLVNQSVKARVFYDEHKEGRRARLNQPNRKKKNEKSRE